MEIGALLKEARTNKQMTLDDVQEATKIQKRYLVALEEGNYDILPGTFYVKAFIKEYALVVGLDAQELLEEHKMEIPETDHQETAQYTRIGQSRKSVDSNKNTAFFSFLPTVIVIVLIIGIFFAAWFFYQKTVANDSTEQVNDPNDNVLLNEPLGDNQNHDQADNNNNDNGNQQNNLSDDNADNQQNANNNDNEKTPELSVIKKGSGTSPLSTLALKNVGDTVKLTFSSKGKSYLAVHNEEGKSYFAKAMTPDDSPMEIDVSGDKRVYINVGYAPDLSIKVNGVELKYPVDANDYNHQKMWINIEKTSEK